MSQRSAAEKIAAMSRTLAGIRGGSPLLYFLDAAGCGARHGASPENYFVLRFFELPEREQAKYLTSGRSRAADRALNRDARPEERRLLARKELFDRAFTGLVRRDFVYAPDCSPAEFRAFLERHGAVILKPAQGLMGRGIEKLRSGAADWEALYRRCREERLLLEECIPQHPALAAVNASSLNSVRVNAARDRAGRVRLIGACLKCGTGDAVSDNFHAGGLAYPLDLETGRVLGPGRNNRDLNEYVHHPGSMVFMPGFQVPFWPQVTELVYEGMDRAPSLGYVGWDVAVRPEGPELIEGNVSWPGGNIIQFDRVGKRALLEECMGQKL